jgi:peptide/nickel transport system ATP-binding protein
LRQDLLGYTNPGLRVRSGSVRLGTGEELIARPDRELRRVRGRRIGYVAQDPSVALNPALRVDTQVRQVQRSHGLDDGRSVESLLETVRLPADQSFRRRFPHELSGGQQQRLAIAVALAARPDVLVLDEPTTALDVVTQEQLLVEIERLKVELRLAVVYVSHDLAVVADVADRVAVMYAGRLIELGSTMQLLEHARHPYSRGLLTSIPDVGTPRQLRGIPGVAVAAWESPDGCAFAPRCPRQRSSATARCRSLSPSRRDTRCGAFTGGRLRREWAYNGGNSPPTVPAKAACLRFKTFAPHTPAEPSWPSRVSASLSCLVSVWGRVQDPV